jgi:hypothetical protein
MTILAVLLVLVGAGISLATWVHDLRRLRIVATLPQAAPSRIAPEVHALGAALTGAGCGLLWGWMVGVAAAVAQSALAYAVAPPMVERLADRLPPLE